MQSDALPSSKMTVACGNRTSFTCLASLAPCAAGKWLMKRWERTSTGIGGSKAVRRAACKPLELDGQAHFDDLHRRKTVIIAHRPGIAAQEGVQAFLPMPHAGVAAGNHHFPVKIISGLVEFHGHARL